MSSDCRRRDLNDDGVSGVSDGSGASDVGVSKVGGRSVGGVSVVGGDSGGEDGAWHDVRLGVGDGTVGDGHVTQDGLRLGDGVGLLDHGDLRGSDLHLGEQDRAHGATQGHGAQRRQNNLQENTGQC